MKDSIKFFLFFIYTTTIFFLQNPIAIIGVGIVNLFCWGISKVGIRPVLYSLYKVLPFILFTVIVDIFLMTWQEAIAIGVKLGLVCHITYLYGKTTTAIQLANAIVSLVRPFHFLKIEAEEIQMLVCISISMLPVLQEQYRQTKEACIAKGIGWKLLNMKYIFHRFLMAVLERSKQMNEAFLAKGIER